MEINKENVYISCFFWIQNYSAEYFCAEVFFGIIFSKNERVKYIDNVAF